MKTILYHPRKTIVSGLFLFLAFCSLTACGQSKRSKKIQFYEDTLQMKTELLVFVPIGTDIEKATEIIQKNKIDCEIHEDGDFWDGTILRENIDYLYCNHEETGLSFITRRWQIAIVFKDGKVTDILVSFGLIGP